MGWGGREEGGGVVGRWGLGLGGLGRMGCGGWDMVAGWAPDPCCLKNSFHAKRVITDGPAVTVTVTVIKPLKLQHESPP